MKRRAFFLLFASVAGLGALGVSPRARAEPSAANLKKLTIDEVSAKLHAPKTLIFDNNSKESWAAGHVPGATWLDDESVTAAALGPDKTAMLIFYCHNEGWHACHTAAVAAEKLGYVNVFIMPQGIAGWKKAGKPIEKG